MRRTRCGVVAVAAVAALAAGCATGEGRSLDAGPIGFDVRPADGRMDCTTDVQCGDRIACTVDHCRGGLCVHEPCTDCCAAGLACVPDFGCRTAPTPCTMDAECNDGIRCTLDRCRDRTSCEHLPQPELCGPGQVCLPAVGCIPEPPTMCTTAADCERGALCIGEWSCQEEFGCQFVSLRDCDDGDACTLDVCVEERGGCVHDVRDGDADLHPDGTCAGGDDCDDADPARHPGATEACNGEDDDCDGTADEGCCTTGPCTTDCGSTGTRECTTGGVPGACVPPAESCNGADDDCDGTTDEGCCTAGPCTTACGSAGTRECTMDGTPGACVPPAESCNGVDDDCDAMPDDGLPCVLGASTACTTTCGSTGAQTCGPGCTPGACVAPTESCNGLDDDCDAMPDDGLPCVLGSSMGCSTACGSTGTRACLPGCTLDSTCVPPLETCNGVDDDCDAACDDGFTCCRGATTSCTTMGYYAGSATCRADCGGWNTSACTNCGNGTRNPGETCDGADLGGATCASIGMGFGSGILRCAAGCTWDTAGCSRCGNGAIDTGESCDGLALGGATCSSIGMGFSGGTLACTPACAFDTSRCTVWDPTGLYTTAPVPTYTCAFGLVSLAIGTFVFMDAGGVLSVTGAPCTMTGASARPSRTFDVSCTIGGGCPETYRLTGTFTSDNVWSGTFRATFGPGGCADCTSRMWSLTGTR